MSPTTRSATRRRPDACQPETVESKQRRRGNEMRSNAPQSEPAAAPAAEPAADAAQPLLPAERSAPSAPPVAQTTPPAAPCFAAARETPRPPGTKLSSVRISRRLVELLLFCFAALLMERLVARGRLHLSRPAQPPSPPRCSAVRPDAAQLARLVPPEWANWAAAAVYADDRAAKAPVLLLVASPGRAPTHEALQSGLLAAFPGCADRCFGSLDLASLRGSAQPRAALQRALVQQLRLACPSPAGAGRGPLLLLRGLHAMPAAAASALLPLLSEGGAYMAEGEGVAAHRATVVLLAELQLGGAADEEAFARAAKAELQRLFGEEEGPEELGRALRRRIDFVAPLWDER